MKANPEKRHLIMNLNKPTTIKIGGGHTISNSYCEKLLGVKVDNQLNLIIILKQLLKKPVIRYMFWLSYTL